MTTPTGGPAAVEPSAVAVDVRVPATSANLGPGFDSFGLALAWYDEVRVELADDGLSVDVRGEGADDVPRDESHLVVSALLTALRRWHADPPGLRLWCHNTIPHGRGLGSSAAAIVAGVVAARRLLGVLATGPAGPADAPVGDAAVLNLASELEGHPDNVAAALAGGLALAWQQGAGTRAVRLAPHESVQPVLCVPDREMSTHSARGLLPSSVPHRDAVFNATRSGLLVAAMTALPEELLPATEDRLHQQYRAGAMPETAELVSRLRARGVPAVVSGAGPTVLALCDARRQSPADVADAVRTDGAVDAGWRVEVPGVDAMGVRARTRAPGTQTHWE